MNLKLSTEERAKNNRAEALIKKVLEDAVEFSLKTLAMAKGKEDLLLTIEASNPDKKKSFSRTRTP